MKEKCDPRECSERQVKWVFEDLTSCDTNEFYTEAMQKSLKKEGYEHFRDRAFKKLENGNYIVNVKALGLPREICGEI